MELEVEILSSEKVKPSTPTPPHLKHLKLSLIDQLVPWIYTPTVFFYLPTTNPIDYHENNNIILRLKNSLSKTLSLFHPLAGRFTIDESTIDCNDEGIPFVVARAKCTLSDFLGGPHRVDSLHHLLSVDENIVLGANPTHNNGSSGNTTKSRGKIVKELSIFAVQVNMFDCGGVAIGCFGLHKLLDGASAKSFLRCWASFAAESSGDDAEVVIPTPDFATAVRVFPPLESEKVPKGMVPLPMWPTSDKGGCVVKPFVFSTDAIRSLKNKGMSEEVPHPTRIEAVSGFIWNHVVAAAKISSGPTKSGSSMAFQVVNIRPHTIPPLPTMSVGNLIIHATTTSIGHEEAVPKLGDLIIAMRRAISKVRDPEFLRELQGERGGELVLQSRKHLGELLNDTKINTFRFTSWGKFDMDFGFGKPIWTGIIGGKILPFFRCVTPLLDTPNNGIEAWLILDEDVMTILESIPDFLALASPSSSGLSY